MSAPAPAKPFNLAIVGGGVIGVTLAIALLKHDVPFTIYESAAQFTEIGAGIAWSPNSVRAMGLVSPLITEVYQRCRTQQLESKRHIWFTAQVGDNRKAGDDGTFTYKGRPFRVGEKLFDVCFTNLQAMDGMGGVGGVHRAHFLNQLMELLPPSVTQFGKRLVSVSKATDSSSDVVLHFADGTTAQHTAILGCDGIKSQTRKLLLGGDEWNAEFTGKYTYRGLVPMTKAVEILGEERAKTSQIYFGYHGHILTFPIEKGKTMNVVAFGSRDEWTSSEWVVRVSKEEMEADFRTYGSPASAIISAMERQDMWALFDSPPAPTYYKSESRICLVGDAAHASTPHQGMGAGMGIEDCYILGNLIGEAKSVEELDRAFRAYDQVRRPRTQKVVKTSREAGQLWDFELGDDLEALEQNMRSRMYWMWDIDLPAELDKARAMARQPTA